MYRRDLVDPLLKRTYKELPKLPRYALKAIDYALQLTFFCFFLLEWQTTVHLGVPVTMRAVSSFHQLGLCISPPIWSESLIY